MHKLYEYACDELETLEKKAGEKGLSAAELEYATKLAELKKDLLKVEMLEDEGYSAEYRDDMRRGSNRSYRGGSYARGRGRNARRDSMGRYSGDRYSREEGYSMDPDDLIAQLEDLKGSAPDDMSRRELAKLIEKMRNA